MDRWIKSPSAETDYGQAKNMTQERSERIEILKDTISRNNEKRAERVLFLNIDKTFYIKLANNRFPLVKKLNSNYLSHSSY